MARRMRIYLIFFIIISLLDLFSCGGIGTYSTQSSIMGKLKFIIKWPEGLKIKTIPVNSSQINIYISGDGISQGKPIYTYIKPPSTRLEIMVPTGRKNITAYAVDVQNTILATGNTTIIVHGKSSQLVNLELIEIKNPLSKNTETTEGVINTNNLLTSNTQNNPINTVTTIPNSDNDNNLSQKIIPPESLIKPSFNSDKILGEPVEIEIIPNSITIEKGVSVQFICRVKDAKNRTSQVNAEWRVNDNRVGSIDQNGLFISKQVGITTIIAIAQGFSRSLTARVTNNEIILSALNDPKISPVILPKDSKEPVELVVNPSSSTIKLGLSIKFNVIGKDSLGNSVPVEANWKIDNENIGSIDNTGLFTSKNIGVANIIVTSGKLGRTIRIVVIP